VIEENAEPPEDSPADAPQEPVAEEATPAAPPAAAEPVAAAEPDVELDEDDDDDEPVTPRVKPAIPGADLEVDIVAEGADPLAGPDEEEQAAIDAAAEQDRADEQPVAATIDLAAGARYRATGKRKTAVARVILRPGTGAYTINGKTLDAYFPRPALGRNIRQPLEVVGYEDRMDVVARIHGGGVSSQSGALRHGISRALLEADPSLRGELKRRGFLTRDSRVKERKKAGLKKARKKPQFSKR
jgi:small subunit ribosomal protein S9